MRADSVGGRACLEDFEWAFGFAHSNRDAILAIAAEAVFELCGVQPDPQSAVDIHHNYVRQEHHCGRSLWIHRKGAIAAGAGVRALIPGSMGTASYLVEGLGERSSFKSGSHGAGRVMTRKEARARISPRQFGESLRRIVYDAARSRTLVEESPAAYRDIKEVLEDEQDLVRPVMRLEPLAVLKG